MGIETVLNSQGFCEGNVCKNTCKTVRPVQMWGGIVNYSSSCSCSLEHNNVFCALRSKHAGKKVPIYPIIRCVMKKLLNHPDVFAWLIQRFSQLSPLSMTTLVQRRKTQSHLYVHWVVNPGPWGPHLIRDLFLSFSGFWQCDLMLKKCSKLFKSQLQNLPV